MLILDCYNVLHTPKPAMLAGLDEAGLCRTLARTAWINRTGGVVVVADGKPKPLPGGLPGEVLRDSPAAGVELLWSGPGRSADSVIIRMVNEHSAPRRVIVVSTDREVRAKARRRRCRVWTSEQFITKLVEQLRRGGGAGAGAALPRPAVPPEGLSPHEVALWMDELGIDADQPGDGPAFKPPAPPREQPPSEHTPRDSPDHSAKPTDPPDEKRDDDDPFNIPGVWPPW